MRSDEPDDGIGLEDDVSARAGEHATDEDPKVPSAREIGGRDGPDPTRYGDWEKAGRCIDF